MACTPSRSRTDVAGGPGDFMTVRHLRLRGSHRDIGHALALEAIAEFPPVPGPVDPLLNRARRRWVQRCWPEHYERMRGIADALGIDLHDDHVSTADLFATPFAAGCSALWCPPGTTEDGHARIGRNFDFVTVSAFELVGMPPDPAQPAMMSRPYVIETYPDDGYNSVVIAALDLTGCFEGINDTGLTVALFADDESETLRPARRMQAGLYEVQVPRFLLDTCATVDEAIEALYTTKQYDNMFPCHYLVADASGSAFVWERDTHNAEHVVRADERPFCVTNHLLHHYERTSDLPKHDRYSAVGAIPFRNNTYERARTLERHGLATPLSVDDVDSALEAVRVDGETTDARTLWYSRYDLDARALTVEFYLGDHPDGSPRRSPPVTFTVAGSTAG